MRTGGTFETQALPPHQHVSPPSATTVGWRSPVPYLFGGLAAMLGLIAFALLILACSYWKLSGHLDVGESEDGKKADDDVKEKTEGVMRTSILVIMAGDEKPTFLATPATTTTTTTTSATVNRATSVGEKSEGSSSSSSSSSNGESDDDEERGEKVVELRVVGGSNEEEDKR